MILKTPVDGDPAAIICLKSAEAEITGEEREIRKAEITGEEREIRKAEITGEEQEIR